MAFTIPDFNLDVDVYTVTVGAHAYRFSTVGNLSVGRRVADTPYGSGEAILGSIATLGAKLLLPALTDVRDASCGGLPDVVDVPAGSGRFYLVVGVDDLGKGFPNEHRYALLTKIWNFAGNGAGMTSPWPTPIP